MESAQDAEINWPNFFVVGAHKAGTTSVYRHLRRHPQVFLPDVKEPRYFTPDVRGSVSLHQYRALYADAKGYKAIGDITPFYLPSEDAPARIREVCPAASIVILLRDPVERAYSHYLYENRNANAESFHKALRQYESGSTEARNFLREYIEYGRYHAPVRRYFDTFGRDRVLVLLFDDLAKNPNQLLMRIAQHIGVDPGFLDALNVSAVHNPYSVPKSSAVRWVRKLGAGRLLPDSLKLAMRPLFFNMKKPALDNQSRRQLQDLYDPDVTRLEELLGRKLPELRRTWA